MSAAILVGDTTYQPGTDPAVIAVLEQCRRDRTRIVVETGDPATGRCYDEERYAGRDRGRVGRTTGNHSPILVHNTRSLGGALISTASVVRIRTTVGLNVLYTHPEFRYTAEGEVGS